MDMKYGEAKKNSTGMILNPIQMILRLQVRILIINTFPLTSNTIAFLPLG